MARARPSSSTMRIWTMLLSGEQNKPILVFDFLSADKDGHVFRTVNALLTNTGQICFAATRVYVQSGIYDKFVEEYAKAFRAKHDLIGDPNETGKEIGPVVDKSQFDRIMGIISNAKEADEGHLLMGGQRIGTKVRNPFPLIVPPGVPC